MIRKLVGVMITVLPLHDPSQCIGAAQAYDIGIDLGLAPVNVDVNVDRLPTRI